MRVYREEVIRISRPNSDLLLPGDELTEELFTKIEGLMYRLGYNIYLKDLIMNVTDLPETHNKLN